MPPQYIRKSLLEGLKSLRDWYAIFGQIAAVVAVTNFVFSAFNLEAIFVLKAILNSYRDIVHGAISWLLYPFRLRIPWFANDFLFIYTLIGGSFMRSRASEGIYPDNGDAIFWSAVSALLFKKELGPGTSLNTGRLYLTYKYSPDWLRRTMDFVLWPRVARQYFNQPCVYRNEHTTSIQTFAADYTPGGRKTFLFDRRFVFLVQVVCITAGVLAIVIINGFSASPLVTKI